MDRDHLHRVGVRLEAPRALLGLRLAISLDDTATEPIGQCRRSDPLDRPRFVQQLRDVAQVGHEPLAIGTGQHTGRQAGVAADRLVQRGDTLVAEAPGPAVQGPVEILPSALIGASPPLQRTTR